MGDAKVLLTLALSSFKTNNNMQEMKRFFGLRYPISVGDKVTFLKPDTSPVKVVKHIECRNYSFNSNVVMRGTAVGVSKDRRHVRIEHLCEHTKE